MPKPTFANADELAHRIAAYFEKNNEGHLPETNSAKEPHSANKKALKDEPATIAGLALFLGFNSRNSFDAYEKRGRFAGILRRGRLQVEAEYEKKLHLQSSSGAVFALKSLGWNEKPETNESENKAVKKMKIKIIETGVEPASDEKGVIL